MATPEVTPLDASTIEKLYDKGIVSKEEYRAWLLVHTDLNSYITK
jgi:hypothetical protein